MSTPRNPTLTRSHELLARARTLIPGATQTLAKGPRAYVQGVAPVYLARGRGAQVWDVDGNEYVDLTMALGPLSLGYAHPAVDDAIRAQLEDGITFSLMHPLEVEVAAQVQRLVPCAERVRFSKTGADVCSAAVRLARAHTGRDEVACCGYHGWHDWYAATLPRNGGVPGAVRALTKTFAYNDLDAAAAVIGPNTACVMLEPVAFEAPREGFLAGLRKLCDDAGALLVFDEMWTGFRLNLGGAQACYGVTPDMAVFSKAIANGMPLSVLAGRADVMERCESDIFFYTTFGGEALSLAAARATLAELERHAVPSALAEWGAALRDAYNREAARLGLDCTSCVGLDCRGLVTFREANGQPPLAIKSLLQQEMLRRGVLWGGLHVPSFAHGERELQLVIDAYRESLAIVAEALAAGDLLTRMRGEVLQPLDAPTRRGETR